MKKLLIILLLVFLVSCSAKEEPKTYTPSWISDLPESHSDFMVTQLDRPLSEDLSNEELTKLANNYMLVSNRASHLTKEQVEFLKAQNPDLIVIKYLNFASGHEVIDNKFRKENPETVLKDKEGEMYRGLLNAKDNDPVMDPSSELWRQTLIDASLEAIDEGHDGIMADQIVAVNNIAKDFAGINLKTGEPYTTEEYRDEMYETLRRVKEAMGPDKLLFGNSIRNGQGYFEEEAHRFLEVTDGLHAEGCKGHASWDTKRYYNEEQWKANVDMVVDIQERGGYVSCGAKYHLNTITSQEDLAQHILYTFTSYMLGHGETSGFNYNEFNSKEPYSSTSPYLDYFTIDYGEPLNDYYEGDVYQRDYENAKFLVNPTEDSININLDETYETLQGEIVTEATLEKHSGLILLNKQNILPYI